MSQSYEVEIIKADHVYSLEEVCQRIRIEEDFVVQCVDYGILEASGNRLREWRFSHSAVERLQKAYRLRRDLDINFTGLGVILDLLEDNRRLSRSLDELRSRLACWEP